MNAHLTAEHRTRLQSQYGIDPDNPKIKDLIDNGLLRSIDDPLELKTILYRDDISGTGIYIAYPNHGETFAVRLDTPWVHDGKKIKYLKKAGQPNELFIMPGINIDELSDIIITEGELKAIAASQYNLPVIALSGIWCWRTRNPHSEDEKQTDEIAILPEFIRDWKAKKIVLLYDSDITRRHPGYSAFERLAEQLYKLGAKEVKIVTLPSLNADSKTGLDDFLIEKGEIGIKDLRLLIDKTKPYQPIGRINYESITVEGKAGIKLSPTKAATAVLRELPLAVSVNSDIIYAFDGHIWKPDGERIIDKTLCRVVNDLATKHSVNEVTRRVRNELAETPAQFDNDPYKLPLENGIMDLRTGGFRDIYRDDYITFRYAARYDPSIADARLFLWFLCSVFPDPLDVLSVIDVITATAIRKPFDILVLLIGSGSNGKGILEKFMLHFFTLARSTAITLKEANSSRFGPASLLNKDLWIVSEVQGAKDAINFLKKISTGEFVDSDVKYSGRVQGTPHVTTVMDTNKAFSFGDNTHGRKRRLAKLDCPYTFGDRDDQRPIDRHIEEKLKQPEVLAGLVRIIAARAPTLIESMKIFQRKRSDEVEEEYSRQRFSLNNFCNDCLSEDPLAEDDVYIDYLTGKPLQEPPRTLVDDIYNEYIDYCKRYNVTEPAEKEQVGKYLRERYQIDSKSTSKIENGETIHYRYYPYLYIVKSAKAAYAENKMDYAAEDSMPPIGGEYYSNYRDTTDILQRWIGDINISDSITTDTTDNFLYEIVDEILRMSVYISSHENAGENRLITYEDYLQFSCSSRSICGDQVTEAQLSNIEEEVESLACVVCPEVDPIENEEIIEEISHDGRIEIAAKMELTTCGWIDPKKIAFKLELPLDVVTESLDHGYYCYSREDDSIGYKPRPSAMDYVERVPLMEEAMI